MPNQQDIRRIAAAFCPETEPVGIRELTSGNVNATYRLDYDTHDRSRSLVLQRINTEAFRNPEALMENIRLVTGHIRAAQEIARRAGVSGMVAGQSIDLLSEHHEPNEATLQYIHTHKTADLLTAPLLAAAYIAGADEKAISALETFGLCVGLAFQIDDDLLDVLGDAKDLGKQTGMDAQRGKMTWPSLVGVEAAQKKSRELWTRAEEALSVFGDSAWFLRAFAEALAKRKK